MHRMRSAAGIFSLIVILVAACAAPGSGGSGTESSAGSVQADTSLAPRGSAPAGSSETDASRVDIGVLGADPAAFVGQRMRVLARVDQVLVDGAAFLTSPSASEEGQLAVIVRPDAQVDKELAEGRVVWVEGTVVGFTAEELADAGIDLPLEELGDFDGQFALVADAIGDPLAD